MISMNVQKDDSRRKMSKMFLLTILFVLLSNIVIAADLSGDISSEDKASFDQILSPVTKIYNLVKYAATVVAGLFFLFAGITYMMAGNDIKKRDQAKNMAGYVIIGLIVIWAAPLVIDYII